MNHMNQTPEPDQPKPKRGLFRRSKNQQPATEPTPAPVDQPTPEQAEEETCTSPFCPVHSPATFAMPPFAMPVGRGLGGLISAIEQAKKQAAEKLAASPAVPRPAKREWSPMFADEVNAGDLIGAPAGMFGGIERELKVCKIRKHDGSDEDPLSPYFTLLMVDTGSGEVFSPTVSAQQGFRVAPAVPDSPAFWGGGA